MKKITALILAIVTVFCLAGAALAEVKDQVIVSGKDGAGQPIVVENAADGVRITKSISATKDAAGKEIENYFDIELTVEIEESKLVQVSNYSTEIAVVLDISNTMNTKLENSTEKRIDITRRALKHFVTSIANENPDHVFLTLITFNTSAQRRLEKVQINQANLKAILANVDDIKPSPDVGSDPDNTRFTNVEGGLQLAYNNLKAHNMDHQYVILMSDGFPTTYNQVPGNQSLQSIAGWDPYTSGTITIQKFNEHYSLDQANSPISSVTDYFPYWSSFNANYYGYRGYFADAKDGGARATSPNGNNYSDWAAYYAQRLALHMKGLYNDKSLRAADGSYLIGTKDPDNTNRINIFTMGIDIGRQSIDVYRDNAWDRPNIADIMTSGDVAKYSYPPSMYPTQDGENEYIIGSGSSGSATNDADMTYENWLGYVVGGGQDFKGKAYYSLNNGADVSMPYNQIWSTITTINYKRIIETMVAADPMGKEIDFIGFYESGDTARSDQSKLVPSLTGQGAVNAENTASVTGSGSDEQLNWSLGSSGYTTVIRTEQDGTQVSIHTYKLTYRVRIENEAAAFVEAGTDAGSADVYPTNGTTTLTYKVDDNNDVSSIHTLKFPEPSVQAYLGELAFTKKDGNLDAPLSGVEFTLAHSSSCSVCEKGQGSMVSIASQVKRSDGEGKVVFTNIPSGHEYLLSEDVPDGYGDAAQMLTWPVQVAYDETRILLDDAWHTGGPNDGLTIYNQPQLGETFVQFSAAKQVENVEAFAAGLYMFEMKLQSASAANALGMSFDVDSASLSQTVYIGNSASSASVAEVAIPRIRVTAPGVYHLIASEVTQDSTAAGYTVDSRIQYTSRPSYVISFQVEQGSPVASQATMPLVVTGYWLNNTGTVPGLDDLKAEDMVTSLEDVCRTLKYVNIHKTTGFSFDKMDGDTHAYIPGVKFTLTHDDDCGCGYTIGDMMAVSGSTGTVEFVKAPVGHRYTMTETVPVGYKPVDPMQVTISDGSGGSVTVDIEGMEGNVIINEPTYNETYVRFGAVKEVESALAFEDGLFTLQLTYVPDEVEPKDVYLRSGTVNNPVYTRMTSPITSANGGYEGAGYNQFVFDSIFIREPGVYTFQVQEIAGEDPYVSYDTAVYTIVVTVTQGDLIAEHGHFSLDKSYALYKGVALRGDPSQNDFEGLLDEKALMALAVKTKFTNRLNTAEFAFAKRSAFDHSALPGAEFELAHDDACACGFTLNDLHASSDENGQVRFSGVVVGHTYTLSETRAPAGFQAMAPKQVKVVMEDGQAVVYVDGQHLKDVSFDNQPAIWPATVALEGRKTMDYNEPVEAFTFVLKDKQGREVQRVENKGGVIAFSDLVFTERGQYVYTIQEVAGEDEGVLYDQRVYTMTVQVDRQEDGAGSKLVANVAFQVDGRAYDSQEPILFENMTRPPETGDESNIVLWTAIMLCAGAALLVLLKKRCTQ